MKLIKLIIAALVINSFYITDSYSQSSWVRQDSAGTINRSVGFANSNTGFYVGFHKKIRKTTNGGQNWFELPNSINENYRKIICIDENIIFAPLVADDIYKSTDSGNSWTIIPIPPLGVIYGMDMLDAYTGYITGLTGTTPPYMGYILKTTNGGLNWNTTFSSTLINYLVSINCVNKDTTFTCGYTVWKSLNSGLYWSQYTFSIYDRPEFRSTLFINNSTGFMAGKITNIWGITYTYPAIYLTTNGGENWQGKNMASNESGDMFNSIDFFDSENGFAVSDSGCIYRTTNMGNNWTKQTKIRSKILDVCFATSTNAYIALYNGSIYATTNGGWDIPLTPNLISPVNNSAYIIITPAIRWEKVQYNAAQYTLQISLDSNFNTTVLNINSIDTAGYNVPSGILNINNIYFWRINSHNPMYTSSWSQVWKFNTNTPLGPNLILPLNNDTLVSSSQILNWSEVPSVTNYNLQISRDSLFTQNTIDTILSINPNMLMPSLKLIVHAYYFWRVKGININGAGLWSEIWKFKSSDCPVLITPQNNDTGIVYNTIFDWTDYPNSSYYRIQISLDSLFNTVNIDNSYFYSQCNLVNAMQQNKYYFWRVNAR